jgi:hypothetical protein
MENISDLIGRATDEAKAHGAAPGIKILTDAGMSFGYAQRIIAMNLGDPEAYDVFIDGQPVKG